MDFLDMLVKQEIQFARQNPDRVAKMAPLTDWVKEQIRTVSPIAPVTLKCEPSPFALHGRCYQNVLEQATEHGGRVVTGWSCWLDKATLYLEYHAVWQSPNGERLDVTPQLLNEKGTRFVEQREWTVQDFQIFENGLAEKHVNRDRYFAVPTAGANGKRVAECKTNAANFRAFSKQNQYWMKRAIYYYERIK